MKYVLEVYEIISTLRHFLFLTTFEKFFLRYKSPSPSRIQPAMSHQRQSYLPRHHHHHNTVSQKIYKIFFAISKKNYFIIKQFFFQFSGQYATAARYST